MRFLGQRRRRIRWFAVALASAALALAGGATVHYKILRWKRFAVVEPGVLYRSGSLKGWQLRDAIRRHGIRTVFSFTDTLDAEERAVCRELDVTRHLCYLAGDGVGPPDPYLRFLALMDDPESRPVLVHCSAGVQRTGGAVALYRVFFNGWSLEAAIEEMIAMGNDGNRPQQELLAGIQQSLEGRLESLNDSNKR